MFNTFEFESHTIRALLLDGNAWFVAEDIARLTELSNRLLQDFYAKATLHSKTVTGETVRIVHEPSAYKLLHSDDWMTAARFERWVLEEVLPELRRNNK